MFICTGSRCIPGTYCESEDDCLFGLTCVNRFCWNPGGCISDDACPTNQECVYGGCFFFPEFDCERDDDCEPGLFCDFGWCQEYDP